MHDLEVTRLAGEEAIAQVLALVEVSAAFDGHRALSEPHGEELAHEQHIAGEPRGFVGFVVSDPAANHPISGYAHLSRAQARGVEPGSDGLLGARGPWEVELVVHPDDRLQTGVIDTVLLSAVRQEIARRGGGAVNFWVSRPSDTSDAVAGRSGFARGRDLLQLRRPLPVPGDRSPLAVRSFIPGGDEEQWLAVNNHAFEGHPEQEDWDLATLLERERAPWFDADGFLLHEHDGQLAGFCWTKIHQDTDPALGEIYVIAVDPAFQGLHLGRGLVLAGLDFMASRGVHEGMLYVDADNHAAMGLYGNLGFTVHHGDRAYVAEIPPDPG